MPQRIHDHRFMTIASYAQVKVLQEIITLTVFVPFA